MINNVYFGPRHLQLFGILIKVSKQIEKDLKPFYSTIAFAFMPVRFFKEVPPIQLVANDGSVPGLRTNLVGGPVVKSLK